MRGRLAILFLVLSGALSAQDIVDAARNLMREGKYADAASMLENRAMDKAIGFDQNAFEVSITYVEAITKAGDYPRAIDLGEKIQTDFTSLFQESPILEMRYHNLEGFIYMALGQIDLAKTEFKKSLRISSKHNIPENLEMAQLYNDLGLLNWNSGNNMLASEYMVKSKLIREEKLGSEALEVADSYNNLGLIYASRAPDRALEYYKKAKSIYSKVYAEVHPSQAIIRNNIAIIYRQKKLYNESIKEFGKALKLWDSLYEGPHANKAFVHASIGQVLADQGKLVEAQKELALALNTYQKIYGDKHPEVASTYNQMAVIDKELGEYSLALNRLYLALGSNYKEGDVPTEGLPYTGQKAYREEVLLNSLLLIAQAYEAKHYQKTLKRSDLIESLKYLEICDSLVNELRHERTNENDKIALGRTSAEITESAIRICYSLSEVTILKQVYLDKAFYFMERSKSAVLQEAIGDSKAKSFANIPPEYLQKEERLKREMAMYVQQSAENPDLAQELDHKLFDLRREYEVYIGEMEKSFPDYFALKYANSTVTVQDVQTKLKEGELLVSYFVGENSGRLFVYTISKDKRKLYNRTLNPRFERLINGLRNGMKYNAFDTYAESARSLYKQLIPFSLNKNTKLIIVPDGRLGVIPFEALVSKKYDLEDRRFEQLSYLIEKAAVSYSYSASLFIDNSNATYQENSSFLLCAPIEFDKEKTGGLGDLPGTESEVDYISELCKKNGKTCKVIKRLEASEEAIQKLNLDEFSFLHLATHGLVNEKKPEQSKIFLTPSNGDNGNLYSGEVYNLKLNSNLVVLSACQTGLGKISKGEGVIGLGRALMFAGAKNLLLSYWTVSDESTSSLMGDFYDDLASHQFDHDYSRSLRQSKLNLMKTERFASPYYWAAFILVGK